MSGKWSVLRIYRGKFELELDVLGVGEGWGVVFVGFVNV